MKYQLKILPPTRFFFVFGFIYSAFVAFDLAIKYQYLTGVDHLFGKIRLAWCCVAALTFAVIRISKHPGINTKYSQWLQFTPWRPGKKLPNGPVGFCFLDLLVLSALTFMGWQHDSSLMLLVPIIFFMVYSLASLGLFGSVEEYGFCFPLLFFALPLLVYPFMSLYAAFAVSLTLFSITHVCALQVLKKFPWNMPSWTINEREIRKSAALGLTGWPFSKLCIPVEKDKKNGVKITQSLKFVSALIIGAWFAWLEHAITRTVLSLGTEEFSYSFVGSYVIILIGATLLSLIRLLVYASKLSGPISLFGRIATGRFIIPGYDKIFIAPLATLVAAATLPPLLNFVGLGLPWICDISILVLFALIIGLPPGLTEWQFTGKGNLPKPNPAELGEQKKISAMNIKLKITG